jgi:hypothetical protein
LSVMLSVLCPTVVQLKCSSWMLSLAADAKYLNCTFLLTTRQWRE